jgi:hypothetical protein
MCLSRRSGRSTVKVRPLKKLNFRVELEISAILKEVEGIKDLLKMRSRHRDEMFGYRDEMLKGVNHLKVAKAQDHPLLYTSSDVDKVIAIGTRLAQVTLVSKAAEITMGFPDYFHEELTLPGVPFQLGTPPQIHVDRAVVLRSTPHDD